MTNREIEYQAQREFEAEQRRHSARVEREYRASVVECGQCYADNPAGFLECTVCGAAIEGE